MRFLADESCDAAVSRALLAAEHDVKMVRNLMPGATDRAILHVAVAEERILLTEDKDFGNLVFETGASSPGVILVRFPALARQRLPQAILSLVDSHGSEIAASFVVLEPGRARVVRAPSPP